MCTHHAIQGVEASRNTLFRQQRRHRRAWLVPVPAGRAVSVKTAEEGSSFTRTDSGQPKETPAGVSGGRTVATKKTGDQFGKCRPSALARKTAIWARVTGDSGSYVVGVTPPVIPEAFSASMYWKAQ